jgi:hypothetical protein
LKERKKELEIVLLLKPLFAEPISTIQPLNTLKDIPKSSSKIKGCFKTIDFHSTVHWRKHQKDNFFDI